MVISIEDLKVVAQGLVKCRNVDKSGLYITRSSLSEIHPKVQEILKMPKADWASFRDFGVPYLQEACGIAGTTGQGGSFTIGSVSLTHDIGSDLAKKCLKDDVKEGLLTNVLADYLGEFLEWQEELGVKIDLGGSFKEGFRSRLAGNKSYRFVTSSEQFKLSTFESKFTIKAGGRKAEDVLCEVLLNQGHLSPCMTDRYGSGVQLVNLTGSLTFGRLQNPDIAAVSRVSYPDGEKIRLGLVEVKRDNSPSSVFQAISQAVSYKAFCNEVWIAIPGMTYDEYHDPESHHQMLSQCDHSGIGVISIGISEDGVNVTSVTVVLSPRTSEILEPKVINWIIDSDRVGWSYCQKCRGFFSRGENVDDINNCGWMVDGRCARELEEKFFRYIANS